MVKLFTYGTLKKGFHNHKFIKDSLFLGFYSLPKHDMYLYVYYGFPYITKGNGDVFGELYEVADEEMFYVDKLEGGYDKKETTVVSLKDGTKEHAVVYYMEQPEVFKIETGIFEGGTING